MCAKNGQGLHVPYRALIPTPQTRWSYVRTMARVKPDQTHCLLSHGGIPLSLGPLSFGGALTHTSSPNQPRLNKQVALCAKNGQGLHVRRTEGPKPQTSLHQTRENQTKSNQVNQNKKTGGAMCEERAGVACAIPHLERQVDRRLPPLRSSHESRQGNTMS